MWTEIMLNSKEDIKSAIDRVKEEMEDDKEVY